MDGHLLEVSDGYPAKGYFRLVHWSYMNFLHASLIYNVEIRRLVPEKLPERTFQMQLRIRQGKGIHLLQPWIFLFISGRCVPEHLFFFLVIADLICKHLVIDKAAAADCLLYLNSLLFIWIDPYFYGAVHSSHPGFLYTAVSFQSLLRLH